jgi:ribonuclease VapC
MKYLLDASAVLAALLGEPGAERVEAAAEEAAITIVNLAEVAQRLAMRADAQTVLALLKSLELAVIVLDEADSLAAGLMRADTRSRGLSLGDRFCLAAARRRGLVALTADRAWADVAAVIGVKVELIR